MRGCTGRRCRPIHATPVQFESGATGTLATVRAAPMYWRVMVFGANGWAEAREETMLTVAQVGKQPEAKTYPAVDSLGVLLESFGETIETGKPFPVTTSDMLDVAGAFEAIIKSMGEGRPVKVERFSSPPPERGRVGVGVSLHRTPQ